LATPIGSRLVVRRADHYIDVVAADPNLPGSLRELLEAGPDALAAVKRAAANPSVATIPVAGAKYRPPIPDPAKILCIGLNYRDHAIEGGKAIPTEPVVFGKFCNTLIAHGDSIVLPKVSQKVDYEAELVIVIGKRGRHISVEKAFDYVAGYTCGHDVS